VRKTGKTITLFAIFSILLSVAFNDLNAIIDISARSDSFSLKREFVRRAPSSKALAKSLAHYTMGIIYDNEGKQKEAVREYRESIKAEPNVSYIHTRLAVDYLILKEDENALAELAFAERLDPSDTKPKFLTALIYSSQGKFAEAQKKYEEVTRLDPESLWALSSLADILVLQEKMNEAASIYEKLIDASAKISDDFDGSEGIEKADDLVLLYFNLAVIYSRVGRIDDALEKLKEAIKLKPDHREAYMGAGLLYEIKKDYREAVKNFEKALEIDPVNTVLYHHIGMLYYKLKDTASAVRQYETLIKIDPKDAAAYLEWANIYLKDKKTAEAIAVLEKAAKNGIKNIEIYVMAGYVYTESGDFDKAAASFTAAQELDADNPKVYFFRGILHEKKGDRELAVKDLREAIKLKASFAEAYNYLGYLFAESGTNLDEATVLIKKALEIDPNNGAYIDSLGWAYFQKGMIEEALVELEKAVKLEPDEPEIKGHLETVRKKLGR